MTRETRTRRRLLQLTGVAASTALIAGCGGPGEEEGEDEPAFEEGTGNGQDREGEEDPDDVDDPAEENDDGEDNDTGDLAEGEDNGTDEGA